MKVISFIARALLFVIFVIPISAKLLFKGEPLAAIFAFVILGTLAFAATSEK